MSTKTSIASNLRERLRAAILSGEYPPASRLRLEQLGENYGVSLSPLREALLRLTGEGLVVSEDQRGFAVADVSAANLAEVTSLRALLEPYALRLAIEHGTLQWEERLAGVYHRLTRAEEQVERVPESAGVTGVTGASGATGMTGPTEPVGRDATLLQTWEPVHRDFHFALLEGCGMPMLLAFCGNLYDRADRYRRLHLEQRPPQPEVRREHRAILDAALARDAARASAALREHIERSSRVIQAFLREREALPAALS